MRAFNASGGFRNVHYNFTKFDHFADVVWSVYGNITRISKVITMFDKYTSHDRL